MSEIGCQKRLDIYAFGATFQYCPVCRQTGSYPNGFEEVGWTRSGDNEGRVEDQPRCIVGDLRLPPQFNLALQRLEIPLNPVNSNRERISQVETLGVFGKDRRENTSASHVVARNDNRFLSILSIKCGNWFYWADRAETAERAESKESPVFMHI